MIEKKIKNYSNNLINFDIDFAKTKYVAGNLSLLKLPEGKKLIVNSEVVKNGKHIGSQLYQNKSALITRINALDMQNTYCKV